jgi:hypothetical protein
VLVTEPRTVAVSTADPPTGRNQVSWPARSLIRNLTEVGSCPGSIRKLRAACVVQAPSGFAVMPARWARRVPGSGDDQGIGAAEQHGIHMDEVGGGEAAGLRGQELLPRWARAAWCGVDPGGFPVGCR